MDLNVAGCDYAWGRPSPRVLKNSGYRFVMRYLSYDTSKNITTSERQSLFSQGIGVGLVWETTANRALAGYAAGRYDALAARGQANAVGMVGAPIYFAVDFDATERQKGQVANYLRGAVSVLGHDRVGVYGGYWVIKYVADHNVCKWLWQTYAWSGGRVHPEAHVYQWKNGVRIDGVSCDLNKAQPVAGIVYPTDAKPKPEPASSEAAKKAKWRKRLRVLRRRSRKADGLPGGWTKTRRVVGRKLKQLIGR